MADQSADAKRMAAEAREAAEAKAEARLNKSVVYKAESGKMIELSIFQTRALFAKAPTDASVTDKECLIFMKLCEARGLNPFDGEAILVKYKGYPAATVVPAIVYDRRADTHPQYEGCESGIWVRRGDEDPVQRFGSMKFPGDTLVGGWSVTYRTGRKPTVVNVSLAEFKKEKKTGETNVFWEKMEGLMIEKVAIATGKRRTFPRMLAGTVIEEEIGPRPVGEGSGQEQAGEITGTGAPAVEVDPVSTMKAEIAKKLETADIKPEEKAGLLSAVGLMQTVSSLDAIREKISGFRTKGEEVQTERVLEDAEVVTEPEDETPDSFALNGGGEEDL